MTNPVLALIWWFYVVKRQPPFFSVFLCKLHRTCGMGFLRVSRTSPMYRAWSSLKGLSDLVHSELFTDACTCKKKANWPLQCCSLTYVHPFPRTYSQWSTQDIPDLTVHGGLRLHVSERLYDGTPPGVVMGCCLRLTALVVFYSHQAAMNCARISLDSQWWSHLVCRSQRPGLRVKLDAWATGFRHESDWCTRKLCEVQNPTSDSHG